MASDFNDIARIKPHRASSRSRFAFVGMRVHFVWFIWATSITAGFLASVDSHLRARREGVVPQYWQASIATTGQKSNPALLMFVNPTCPCSHASLIELQEVLGQSDAAVNVRILFFASEKSTKNLNQNPLWQMAQRIPGAIVERDLNGALASHFGAKLSGFVAMYDAEGRLKFSGGITAGHGHVGDNPGISAIAAILHGEDSKDSSYCVFGCPILSQSNGHQEAVR